MGATYDFTAIAMKNGAAADTGGIFSRLGGVTLNNNGEVVFVGQIQGDGIDSSNDFGIFKSNGASTSVVAREGEAVGGTGTTLAASPFGDFGGASLNDNGEVTFLSRLNGAGVNSSNDLGVFKADGNGLELVARTGDSAPGTGAVFSDFDGLNIDGRGDVTYLGKFDGGGVAPGASGIFKSSGSGSNAVAVAGEATGSAGEVFLGFSTPSANESGGVAFRGDLAAGGTLSDHGIFRSNGGATSEVVRSGESAPGTGSVFSGFGGTPSLNDNGDVAFSSFLQGAGVGILDNQAIYRTDGDDLTLLARTGQQASGTNLNFLDFGAPSLNNNGDVAFFASLNDSAYSQPSVSGIFVSVNDEIDLVLRQGDMLDVGGGDLREVSRFFFLLNAFNDQGALALSIFFADGSNGLFLASRSTPLLSGFAAPVPLPAALPLFIVALGAFGFLKSRRK
ncbi:DUF7453 family protein [Hwanghaeella sp.]|uniref:DUF7453 family protein n=1 Tax=Hwanghaeella sp. TaxID=2605943 RepID=UPI003CCC1D06